MLDIRPAEPEDIGAIKVLLAVSLLPVQDSEDLRNVFFVAESERGIIGVCGIERCSNTIGLLRSLGVMPGFRKQQIGRRLVQRVLAYAEEQGLERLYLLTELATEYFQNSGFTAEERRNAPAELNSSRLFSRLCPANAQLMVRAVRSEQPGQQLSAGTRIAARARAHFDEGFHCAESVLLAAAEHAGFKSPLIPAIATGFSHGTANTWGTCGALNGAIMAISLSYGRSSPQQATAPGYQAVRHLIARFDQCCGSTVCSELMGCDLETSDGRKAYQDNQLRQQCREIVGIAAGLATELIDANRPTAGTSMSSTSVAA